EVEGFRIEVKELTQAIPPRASGRMSLVLVAAGVGLLIAGAHATVTGAVDLGRLWGMSERVIGLTIVAGGTGLPEVVTSLVSSIRGRDDVAIGNIIGSNLFNILGTLGLSGLIHPVQVPRGIIVSDNLWMLGLTLLLFPDFYRRRIARWEGIPCSLPMDSTRPSCSAGPRKREQVVRPRHIRGHGNNEIRFLLTLGTRGDVQPFVALGRGQGRGHEVIVCTSSAWPPSSRGTGRGTPT
ncbi:MAG: hypothetical protein WKF75_01995, partial [Singulisphaera sp.]